MNERIAELLAKLDIDLYTDEGVMMTKILVSPKDLRQFAELIVRECLVVINQSNGVGDDVVIKISRDVEKHFGVEE